MRELADDIRQLMTDLTSAIRENINGRGLRATGRTNESIRSMVTESEFSVRALGYAADHWVNVGSGSPPGTKADPRKIFEWTKVRGLPRRSVYPIVRRIFKEGSKDYREKNPNAFIEAIDRFEADGRFDLSSKAADIVFETIVPELEKLERA